VNKLAYVLIALLFGGIGIHKFYSGKVGLGIVYLLFCWTFIPAIIALIEAIIAATKKQDSEGNILV
jgi:TM2 domain-containing membrane protein YozV